MTTLLDVPIVESQRPELLPLDLQAELHLRYVRTAIAYRKWLRQLGLTLMNTLPLRLAGSIHA